LIANLSGKVLSIGEDTLIVDVSGVGYEVNATPSVLTSSKPGDAIQLPIQTAVKEDSITLYGFANLAEKSVFNLLLKVDRVGPKMAIKIMSGAKHTEIVEAIESGDVNQLSKLPKVGKKMAEQIIFKLKGKLPDLDFSGGSQTPSERKQIASALVNLGYKSQDVDKVIDGLPEEITIEDGVRKGLAALTGNGGA